MEPTTQVSEGAKALLAKLDEKFVTKDDLKTSLTDFAGKVDKVSRSLFDQILETKRSPGFISNRKGWKIYGKAKKNQEGVEMEYSLTRILGSLAIKKNTGSYPEEKEFAHEVEFIKRAISEGTAGTGGSLIPQEWADFVIPELGAQVVVMKAGPNVLPMQHQILNIPGLTTNATCFWIGENGPITEADPSTNNTPLTLHTAASLTGLSIQWLRDASPETDAALQANLVRGMVRFVDNGYLNGTGSSNQPTGMSNIAGISQIFAGLGAANGNAVTLDDISLLIYQLDAANAPEEGRSFFCNPRTVNELRLLRDTLGRPLLWVNPADKLDMRLNGYPVFTSTQIPLTQTRGTGTTASYMLLVAMSDIYVGQGIKSQGLEVAISDQALFTSAEIAVRLLYRTDIQPGHALSVAILSGIL
jgi:HK97 family phage major capsid protein